MTATPQEVDAAMRQLADTATHIIDRRIVAEVLDAQPHLVHTAREWGWDDTEVRDGLFVYLWSHLTGGDPQVRLSESERREQIYRGQRRWLARHQPADRPRLKLNWTPTDPSGGSEGCGDE